MCILFSSSLAKDPEDYTIPTPREVTFLQGSMAGDTHCVTVTITNDGTPEPTEQFTITLDYFGAVVEESMSILRVTIEDDDSEMLYNFACNTNV